MRGRLKLLTILSNLVLSNLLMAHMPSTRMLAAHFFAGSPDCHRLVQGLECSMHHKFGLLLFLELQGVFRYHLEEIASVTLREAIAREMREILDALVRTQSVAQNTEAAGISEHSFWEFFALRRKRLNATMVLLVDLLASDTLSDALLEYALQLGEYYEVKATVKRDAQKSGLAFMMYKALRGGDKSGFQQFVLESEYVKELESRLRASACFSGEQLGRIDKALGAYYHL